MLVVPNCWDVGTWGWLERKIESLFYEWTHLYMDLADIMVNLPYKWTFLSDWSKYIFIYASGILPSPEWILEEERRHWNLKVEKMAINLPSRKIKEDFSFREELFYIISNKLYKCLRICILWFCLPSLVGWAFIDEIKFGFSDVSRACKAYLLGWHVLLGKVLHCFSLWEQGFSKLFYLSPSPPPSLPFPPLVGSFRARLEPQ